MRTSAYILKTEIKHITTKIFIPTKTNNANISKNYPLKLHRGNNGNEDQDKNVVGS